MIRKLNHAQWFPTASEIKTELTSMALHTSPPRALLPPISSSEALSQTRSTNPFLPGLFLRMESHGAAKTDPERLLLLPLPPKCGDHKSYHHAWFAWYWGSKLRLHVCWANIPPSEPQSHLLGS